MVSANHGCVVQPALTGAGPECKQRGEKPLPGTLNRARMQLAQQDIGQGLRWLQCPASVRVLHWYQ